MPASESPGKELDEKHAGLIVKFVSDIKTGKLQGSNNIAAATVTLLEHIINDSLNATAFELLGALREAGRRLARALPQELAAANMVRRVLRAVRDERRARAQPHQSGETAGDSLQRLVLAAPARRATLPAAPPLDLREPLRDHIAELRLELESSAQSICSTSREHVHADELILTYGAGSLVERFLRSLTARRPRLLLAEGPCALRSHGMAARLSAAGVSVTVVSNAAVMAVMSRVNKVVVGVRAALAGGAVLGEAGLHAVTTAAKHYSVPVIALAPLYKLAPLQVCDQRHFNAPAPPHHALRYQEASSGAAHVYAPMYDFVPPDHITLFITNLGGSSPTYIYRLLSELYDPVDYQI